MNNDFICEIPGAVKRLGKDIFLKVPLFRSINPIVPIYINKILFKDVFSAQSDLSCSQMSDFISEKFNFTIVENQSSGLQIGWAYIDKQADPLNIALLGNKGSGRAYYVGSCFNVKGEKTPLATSHIESHANGILKMGDAFWSTVVANSLSDEFEEEMASVLAIIKPDAEEDSEKSIIIRIDKSGSLDRFSHVFQKNVKPSKNTMIGAIRSLARLEAEKFSYRVLHGSWSSGNSSLDGRLIDHDSVCSVKGRQPQCISKKWYVDNYFGFEYHGALKIVKSFSDYFSENYFSELEMEDLFLTNFYESILRIFPYLMGMEDASEALSLCYDKVKWLSVEFVRLSRMFVFLSKDNFDAHYIDSLHANFFDFSLFFRFYPILKSSKNFSIEKSIFLLMDAEMLQGDCVFKSKDFNLVVSENVKPFIKDFLVSDSRKCLDLKRSAEYFVLKYNELYELLVKDLSLNQNKILARSYVINEDRKYLFPCFSLEKTISNAFYIDGPQRVNFLVTSLICASQRRPHKNIEGYYSADFMLFENGCSSISMTEDGFFYIIFEVLNTLIPYEEFLSEKDFFILLDGSPIMISSISYKNEYICLKSDLVPVDKLLFMCFRKPKLFEENYLLFYKQTKIVFSDFYNSFFKNYDYSEKME